MQAQPLLLLLLQIMLVVALGDKAPVSPASSSSSSPEGNRNCPHHPGLSRPCKATNLGHLPAL